MDRSTVQINLRMLDREIASLQKELEAKEALRDYIRTLAPGGAGAKTTTRAKQKGAPKQSAAPKSTPAPKAGRSNQAGSSRAPGLTDFVLDYLGKHPKSENKAIVAAYAKAVGRKKEAVKFNIANTLSRLKDSKVKAQDTDSGRGYLWSLK